MTEWRSEPDPNHDKAPSGAGLTVVPLSINSKSKNLLAAIGPGMLVAATGVGAGDLATAAFTGSRLGIAVLWGVAVGAFLKYVINEGLTRWQLATGRTLLEGCVEHLGLPFRWIFPLYFFLWSFLVGAALMSACGATAHAILPLFTPEADKIFYGLAHSALAVALVRRGGYRLFEKVMAVCIGIMFVAVVFTAVALRPPIGETIQGLFLPRIPELASGGLPWTVALLGGVGGTLTVLCYGYWIREENRSGTGDLWICRVDLMTGYTMTAIFGMSMLVIGSRMGAVEGGGASLLANLASGLKQSFGDFGAVVQWAFLIGAWGAVFSSLLGVWQSLPYLFTDFCNMVAVRGTHVARSSIDTASWTYRGYLYVLATAPAVGLILMRFESAQKTYAIVGALVIPALSAILLYLNNRASLIGHQSRNSWPCNAVLVIALAFFLYAGLLGIQAKL